MTPAIQAIVIGVLSGGLSGVLVTIVGALLNRNIQHTQWLQHERLTSYAEIQAVTSRMLYEASREDEPWDELIQQLNTAVHRAQLITDTAYEEVYLLRREIGSFAVATLQNDEAERDRRGPLIAALMRRLETKARQELRTKPIDRIRLRRPTPVPPPSPSD